MNLGVGVTLGWVGYNPKPDDTEPSELKCVPIRARSPLSPREVLFPLACSLLLQRDSLQRASCSRDLSFVVVVLSLWTECNRDRVGWGLAGFLGFSSGRRGILGKGSKPEVRSGLIRSPGTHRLQRSLAGLTFFLALSARLWSVFLSGLCAQDEARIAFNILPSTTARRWISYWQRKSGPQR